MNQCVTRTKSGRRCSRKACCSTWAQGKPKCTYYCWQHCKYGRGCEFRRQKSCCEDAAGKKKGKTEKRAWASRPARDQNENEKHKKLLIVRPTHPEQKRIHNLFKQAKNTIGKRNWQSIYTNTSVLTKTDYQRLANQRYHGWLEQRNISNAFAKFRTLKNRTRILFVPPELSQKLLGDVRGGNQPRAWKNDASVYRWKFPGTNQRVPVLKTWKTLYNKVLMVVNDGSSHWWLLVINFRTRTIRGYDSLGPSSNFQSVVSTVLNLFKPYHNLASFRTRIECPVRQLNFRDCGIFAILYAYLLSTSKSERKIVEDVTWLSENTMPEEENTDNIAHNTIRKQLYILAATEKK